MNKRFNPPPNWPAPPANWAPPPGWIPDPSWGPAPDGWPLWVDEAPYGGVNNYDVKSAPLYPHTSSPAKPRKKRRVWWIVVPIIIVVFFAGCTLVVSSFSSSGGSQLSSKKQSPVTQEKADAAAGLSERDLALLVKSPDQHKGETMVLYARITQFDAATGNCTFRADIAHERMSDSWEYKENSVFTGQDGLVGCSALGGFVVEDEVRVTATSLGSVSYETQMRGNTTVPAFRVEKIEAVTP